MYALSTNRFKSPVTQLPPIMLYISHLHNFRRLSYTTFRSNPLKSLRPSELHKIFPEATPRVLDLQLKELVEDGLVTKTIYPELPPRSEYTITSLGLTLIPIIDAMIEWGNKNENLFIRKYGKAISNDITEN